MDFDMNFQFPNPVTEPDRFKEGVRKDGVYYVEMNGTYGDIFSDHVTVSNDPTFPDHYSAYMHDKK